MKPLRARIRFSLAALAISGTCLMGLPNCQLRGSGDETDNEKRAKLLGEMRRRAEATNVYRLDNQKWTSCELRPEPVFRYSDQPRHILDATIWVWGRSGRPNVLQKIELTDVADRGKKWLYNTRSLSPDLVQVEWADGHRWSSQKSGLVLQPVPDAPAPARTEAERLRQMKKLAERFTISIADPIAITGGEQLRILPRPIHRYSDTDSGIEDGAIFGFASFGTNPAVLLVFESQAQPSSAPTWHYGPATMTNAEVSLSLDSKEVWKVPHTGGPAPHDTWLWFWEAQAEDAQ